MLYKNLRNFTEVLPFNKRIMCLDYGKKKIGIAFSDDTQEISLIHGIYHRKNSRQDLGEMSALFAKYNSGALVLGLPLELDGNENEICESIAEFAKKLFRKVNAPIYLHDERFSTSIAVNTLKAANFSRKQSKMIEDPIAACVILQSFLNEKKDLLTV